MPIGNKTVVAGRVLQFMMRAFDPDGNRVSYSISNAPKGALFGRARGIFKWMPTRASGCLSRRLFRPRRARRRASEVITITVTAPLTQVNHAPLLEPIGDKTVRVGQTLSFTVRATDPDGDKLSVEMLPPNPVFDTKSLVFSWTPQYTGSYTLNFRVFDQIGAYAMETITVTVTL